LSNVEILRTLNLLEENLKKEASLQAMKDYCGGYKMCIKIFKNCLMGKKSYDEMKSVPFFWITLYKM